LRFAVVKFITELSFLLPNNRIARLIKSRYFLDKGSITLAFWTSSLEVQKTKVTLDDSLLQGSIFVCRNLSLRHLSLYVGRN
jgi:hypothetical protein